MEDLEEHFKRAVQLSLTDEDIEPAHGYRFIAIDAETTGRRPHVDRLTELAAVDLATGHSFQTLVNPAPWPLPMAVSQVTGITPDMVSQPGVPDAPTALRSFYTWLHQLPALSSSRKASSSSGSGSRDDTHTTTIMLVAHNGNRFDFPLLINECARHGLALPASSSGLLCLDSLQLARQLKLKALAGLQGLSLGHLAEHFGVTNTAAHRALADAQALAQILHHLQRLAPQLRSGLTQQATLLQPSPLHTYQPHQELLRLPAPRLGLSPARHDALLAQIRAQVQQACSSCGRFHAAAAPCGSAQAAALQQAPSAPVLMTAEEFCSGVEQGGIAAVRSGTRASTTPAAGATFYNICSTSSSSHSGVSSSTGGAPAALGPPAWLLLTDVVVAQPLAAEYQPEKHAAAASFDLLLTSHGPRLVQLAAALQALATAAVGLPAGSTEPVTARAGAASSQSASASSSSSSSSSSPIRPRSNLHWGSNSLVVQLEGRTAVHASKQGQVAAGREGAAPPHPRHSQAAAAGAGSAEGAGQGIAAAAAGAAAGRQQQQVVLALWADVARVEVNCGAGGAASRREGVRPLGRAAAAAGSRASCPASGQSSPAGRGSTAAMLLQPLATSALAVDCQGLVHSGLQQLLPAGAGCHAVVEPRCIWSNSAACGVKLVVRRLCLAGAQQPSRVA